jgi:hypothetical protein
MSRLEDGTRSVCKSLCQSHRASTQLRPFSSWQLWLGRAFLFNKVSLSYRWKESRNLSITLATFPTLFVFAHYSMSLSRVTCRHRHPARTPRNDAIRTARNLPPSRDPPIMWCNRVSRIAFCIRTTRGDLAAINNCCSVLRARRFASQEPILPSYVHQSCITRRTDAYYTL